MSMNKKLKNLLIKIIISSIIFTIAILSPINLYAKLSLYILSYLIVGYEILEKSFKNILSGEIFDENFLMVLASFVAFFLGEYTEAIAIILFYQIGEFFQSYAVNNSRKSISKLVNIKADYANIEKNGKIEKVNPEEININDIIIIKPGERVPLDGIIVEGQSNIDTSALTGESMPQSVEVKDEILSGCINLSNILKVKVSKKYTESTASKILDLIENATNKKAKVEHFITKFAKIYTPIVVGLAVLIATLPPFILNEEFSKWIYRSMVFLVVSCPCALVISVPLSFFAGIGLASKYGILVKGGNFLELLSKVKYFVFDKTGTLTRGKFEVSEIHNINITEEEFLKYASYAEYYSNHPIAKSIKSKYNQNIELDKIKDIKEIQGKGIEAKIDNDLIYIGNEKIMKNFNINIETINKIGTIVYMAINNKYVGYLVIADQIKSNAKKAIQDLYKIGIQKTIMLTGDKKSVAENVATQLNLSEFHSELLPADKIEKLENIMENNKNIKVSFVGDGINDAPALARADIGIAMGNIGSDVAIESADIVIINDNLESLAKSIKISKRTINIAKENIYFSIGIKIIVLLLGTIGYASIWEAVFADVGVCLIAILNSLRILMKKNIINYFSFNIKNGIMVITRTII